MPVTVELPQELEARLRREAARQGIDPNAFVARALEQHLRGAEQSGGNGAGSDVGASVAHLPAREAELLQQINTGLPPDVWAEYRRLLARRADGTLTPAEQQSLVELSDRIEEANASRLALAAELARLRGDTLDTIVRELGLPGGPRG